MAYGKYSISLRPPSTIPPYRTTNRIAGPGIIDAASRHARQPPARHACRVAVPGTAASRGDQRDQDLHRSRVPGPGRSPITPYRIGRSEYRTMRLFLHETKGLRQPSTGTRRPRIERSGLIGRAAGVPVDQWRHHATRPLGSSRLGRTSACGRLPADVRPTLRYRAAPSATQRPTLVLRRLRSSPLAPLRVVVDAVRWRTTASAS